MSQREAIFRLADPRPPRGRPRVQSLLGKTSPVVCNAVGHALNVAKDAGLTEVSAELVLASLLLDDRSPASDATRRVGIVPESLRDTILANPSGLPEHQPRRSGVPLDPPLSIEVYAWLADAWLFMSCEYGIQTLTDDALCLFAFIEPWEYFKRLDLGKIDRPAQVLREAARRAGMSTTTPSDGSGPRLSGVLVAEALDKAVSGVVFDDYGTEASSEFTVFHATGPFSAVVAEILGPVIGSVSRPIGRFDPADEFFDTLVEVQRAFGPDQAARGEALVAIMKRHVRDVHVVIVGEEEDDPDPLHPIYIVGLSDDGDVVGIKSEVVWT